MNASATPWASRAAFSMKKKEEAMSWIADSMTVMMVENQNLNSKPSVKMYLEWVASMWTLWHFLLELEEMQHRSSWVNKLILEFKYVCRMRHTLKDLLAALMVIMKETLKLATKKKYRKVGAGDGSSNA
jgi:hypothetical protein